MISYRKPRRKQKRKKKGEKKRQRINSSSSNENSETIQDGAFVTLKLTEYQALLDRLKAVEDIMKEREKHILQLEARLCEAETSINAVKAECSNVAESLNYSQKEQDDLKERMSLRENELSAQGDKIFQTERLQLAIESHLLPYS